MIETVQRRAEVIRMRREGHAIRAIAKALGISPATVHRDLTWVAKVTDIPETPERLDLSQSPDTTNHYPPRLYAGVFWEFLPRVLKHERINALVTCIPASMATSTLLNALDALEETLAASHALTTSVSIMVEKDAGYAAREIERVTQPGDVVLDPYICDGDVVIACHRLGRRCIGVGASETQVLKVMTVLRPPR